MRNLELSWRSAIGGLISKSFFDAVKQMPDALCLSDESPGE